MLFVFVSQRSKVYLLKCSVLDLTFRGLHLGVIHSQTDAVRNLAQVISALPGEDVLNMRNDLYQVNYKLTLYLTTGSLFLKFPKTDTSDTSVPDSFAPSSVDTAQRGS